MRDKISIEVNKEKWEYLVDLCNSNYTGMVEEVEDDDARYYIYEATMEVVLGNDVFARVQKDRAERRLERAKKKYEKELARIKKEIEEIEKT